MEWETIILCFVLVFAIGAFGISATSLDSTMTTEPDDVIELDYDRIPIGQSSAATIRDEIDGSEDSSEAESSDEGTDEGSTTEPDAGSSSADGDRGSAPADGGTGPNPIEQSLLDRLLELLIAFIRLLFYTVVPLGLAIAAIRYRDRLFALLFGSSNDSAERVTVDAFRPWPSALPDDPVEREWATVIQHLNLEFPERMTTSECLRAAIDAGYDPDAIETLTDVFEEVRYGERPTTEERIETARRCRRRLLQGGER